MGHAGYQPFQFALYQGEADPDGNGCRNITRRAVDMSREMNGTACGASETDVSRLPTGIAGHQGNMVVSVLEA
jgi:hypothetical protein